MESGEKCPIDGTNVCTHQCSCKMNKPLREHFEMETDAGTTLRTFDYIKALEDYVERLENTPINEPSGEKQRLTLQECKARIAEELNEHDFESARRHHDWESLLDKVAELYASQSLPIREKPDFEKLAEEYANTTYGHLKNDRIPEVSNAWHCGKEDYQLGMKRIWKDYVEPIR
jgi:hypothetical protein